MLLASFHRDMRYNELSGLRKRDEHLVSPCLHYCQEFDTLYLLPYTDNNKTYMQIPNVSDVNNINANYVYVCAIAFSNASRFHFHRLFMVSSSYVRHTSLLFSDNNTCLQFRPGLSEENLQEIIKLRLHDTTG